MRIKIDEKVIHRLADAEKIHDQVLMHSDLQNITDIIEEIIEIGKVRRSTNHSGGSPSFTENICLVGEPGTGKTTLSHILKEQHPKEVFTEDNMEVTKQPILFTSIQNKSINGLAYAMLHELGDLANSIPNEKTKLTHALEVQLKTAQTELIILDEFHELFSQSNRDNVTSWIKGLINKTGVPILAMGIPGVEALINHSNEISRRFKTESIDVLAYEYYGNNDEFSTYVEMLSDDYMQIINMKSFYRFKSRTDFLRLYLATSGYPSNIAELFKEAAKDAIREDKNTVDINNFAQGFRAARRTSLDIGEHNPFTITETTAKELFQHPIKAAS